jgi:hypothetical protein
MGLFSAIKRGSVDYLFIDEEDIETQEQVNAAQLANLERQRLENKVDEKEFAELSGQVKSNTFDEALKDPANRPVTAFTESLTENYDKLLTGVRNTVGGVTKFAAGTLFKILPWWLWVIILVAALISGAVYFKPQIAIAGRVLKGIKR